MVSVGRNGVGFIWGNTMKEEGKIVNTDSELISYCCFKLIVSEDNKQFSDVKCNSTEEYIDTINAFIKNNVYWELVYKKSDSPDSPVWTAFKKHDFYTTENFPI